VSNWGLEEDTAMWHRVVQAVAGADGRLFLLDHLQDGSDDTLQESRLAALGLRRRDDACENYASHPGGFRLCALTPAQKPDSRR
jgi:hypothetical protein